MDGSGGGEVAAGRQRGVLEKTVGCGRRGSGRGWGEGGGVGSLLENLNILSETIGGSDYTPAAPSRDGNVRHRAMAAPGTASLEESKQTPQRHQGSEHRRMRGERLIREERYGSKEQRE